LLDDFAAAVAVGARLLDHEEALLRADLALPAAQLAAARRGTRLGARATARLAGDRNLDLDLAGAAVERVLELDLQVVAQVGSAARSRASTAEGAPENGLEDVAEVAEIRVRSAGAALGEGGMAITVVGGALLRVLEALVSGADRLELVLVFLAAPVAVGMVLHRELAVRGLDRRRVRIPVDAEQLVEIVFHRRHQIALSPSGERVGRAESIFSTVSQIPLAPTLSPEAEREGSQISPCCLRRLRRTRHRRLPRRPPQPPRHLPRPGTPPKPAPSRKSAGPSSSPDRSAPGSWP